MVEESTKGRRGTTTAEEFVPTEEQILKELKQREQRKKYMQSDKAKEQRKTYMKKRYNQAKSMRDFMKNNPDQVKELCERHGIEVPKIAQS